MLKGYVYNRVSTKDQLLGLSVQENACLEYAKHNGIEVSGVFTDKGYSRASDFAERNGLTDLLQNIKRRSVVIVQKLDRIGETFEVAYLEKLLKKRGVSLVSTKNEHETLLQRRMSGILSEIERSELKKRTTKALEEKRNKREKTGGSIPYGYRIGGYKTETRRINSNTVEVKIPLLEAEPKEQFVIQLIKELRLSYSHQKIVNFLQVNYPKPKARWHIKGLQLIIKRENRTINW